MLKSALHLFFPLSVELNKDLTVDYINIPHRWDQSAERYEAKQESAYF